MRRLTRLQYGHEAAANLPSDLVLASRPELYYAPEAEEAAVLFTGAVDNIVDFAADTNGVDPWELNALAINFVAPNSLGRGNCADLDDEPQVMIGNIVHYPIINVTVDARRSARAINRNLRHEIRHIFQEKRGTLYNRSGVVRAVQVAGGLAAAGAVAAGWRLNCLNTEGLLAEGSYAVGLGGFAVPCMARTVAWCADKDEWDAEIFSYRHRSFQPVRRIASAEASIA